jgi:N-acetylglucosamine repressor
VQVPSKATHQQTREYNERLIVRTVYELGPISRADIARRTHLTRTTVSDIVVELVDRGMVEETGRGPSSGGKAPILLHLVGDARQVIGLDLGEETFSGALVNLRGEVRKAVELPVQGCNGQEALQLVFRLCDTLVQAASGSLLGFGVGTPGLIDGPAGVIRWAVNLDWQDLPLARLISERYELPVSLANDSQAAALAEYAFGEAPRVPNLIVIKVGRGIGAGLVLDGELFQGDGHGAGEIGHIGMVEDGVACRCGGVGCLETVASAPAIVRQARALAAETPGSLLLRTSRRQAELTLDDVRVAFEAGDPAARAAVLTAGRHLGQAVAMLLGTLDIHRVLLHGSVAAFGQPWLDSVRDEARRRSLPLLWGRVQIASLGATSQLVALGASAMLMTRDLGLVRQR